MLLLASQSPRRRALLALLGLPFRIVPAEVDERPRSGEDPQKYVSRLAEAKARAVAHLTSPGWLVLGADTAVVDGDDILGKPANAEEAIRLLKRLRGRNHQVYTALALLDPAQERCVRDLCVTQVPMRAYTDEEIAAYVATGDPLDKAGAYAIQHAGFRPVEAIDGCYANVMGLPLCHLVRTLRAFGVTPHQDVPRACQAALGYACPVFSGLSSGAPHEHCEPAPLPGG